MLEMTGDICLVARGSVICISTSGTITKSGMAVMG
jgi:hypothetical protein